jgi:bile acid:Na+ symporter, BASS family
MDAPRGRVTRAAEFLHHHIVWFVAGAYLLAGVAPFAGLWLRSAHVSSDSGAGISVPSALLALLLFNAGLGVEPGRLRALARRSGVLAAGLAANLIVPVLFVLAASATLPAWHNPAEGQAILVGLALVAAMPVAGSSTAWAQNADGDLALSVGLVIGSTALSPLTTPAILHATGWAAEGQFAEALQGLAEGGTSRFLGAYVMAPVVTGILVRAVVGRSRVGRIRLWLKVANILALLTLCYANAAIVLPGTFANPDWDFLAVMLTVVTGLCALGFATGATLGAVTVADSGQRAALMFGLGMTNNGTGLVVAGTALSHLPEVLLPVLSFNLVQHLVAGVAARLTGTGTTDTAAPI